VPAAVAAPAAPSRRLSYPAEPQRFAPGAPLGASSRTRFRRAPSAASRQARRGRRLDFPQRSMHMAAHRSALAAWTGGPPPRPRFGSAL